MRHALEALAVALVASSILLSIVCAGALTLLELEHRFKQWRLRRRKARKHDVDLTGARPTL